MVGSSHWRPLSQRGSDSASGAPPYHAPLHLYEPVLDWLKGWEAETGGLRAVYLMLRWVPDLSNLFDDLSARIFNDSGALLDVLDATLTHGHDMAAEISAHEVLAEELDMILTVGGSAWRVSDDRRGLTRRVDATVMRSLQAAAESSTSAAEYLSEAWAKIYRRSPDPSGAYHAAVNAAEAAAAPVVSPKNKRATLGTIIRDMEAAPQKWQLAIVRSDGKADLGPLLEPMRLLWHGQTDRHGSGAKPVRITPEAATAAVHLALMLVHWFQSGLVSKRP